MTQFQARTAADRMVRRAFANIARDELRHAELAFALIRWLEARLDDAARRRAREARRAAPPSSPPPSRARSRAALSSSSAYPIAIPRALSSR